MIKSNVIYSKDAKDNIRTWQYEVDGDRWRTLTGLINGKAAVSGWTICEAKNLGKSNETTAEIQAQSEAENALNKKLRSDYRTSIEALNTVLSGPMLAKDFGKVKDIAYPLFSQPKLDGIRAILTRDEAYSRTLKPHKNINHIVEVLSPVFEKYPHIVFDGELYNHSLKDDFNKICSIVRSDKATEEDRQQSFDLIQYHVYDIIDTGLTFRERNEMLVKIFNEFLFYGSVCKVPTTLCKTNVELDLVYSDYLLNGYEGQMVRIVNSVYETAKRSPNLLKRKQFITDEFKIHSINEGVGNWGGYAKSVTFQFNDSEKMLPLDALPMAGIKGNQEFTKLLLEEANQYIGGVVTIKYFGLTPDGYPRFPVAVDFNKEGRVD